MSEAPRIVDMIDAIGADLGVIPRGTVRVASYLTGSGGIAASPAQFADLQKHGVQTVIRIDQAANVAAWRQYPYIVIDIEPGAKNANQAAAEAEERRKLGLRTGFYCSSGDLPAVVQALSAFFTKADATVDGWIADWNLSRSAAVRMLGRILSGRVRVVALQWASPTSNPTTPMPRSRLTLKQANVDLSVTLEDWPADTTKRRRLPKVPKPKPVHRKTKGAAAGGSGGVGLVALLAAFHVHLSPAEWAAISLALSALGSWLVPAREPVKA